MPHLNIYGITLHIYDIFLRITHGTTFAVIYLLYDMNVFTYKIKNVFVTQWFEILIWIPWHLHLPFLPIHQNLLSYPASESLGRINKRRQWRLQEEVLVSCQYQCSWELRHKPCGILINMRWWRWEEDLNLVGLLSAELILLKFWTLF